MIRVLIVDDHEVVRMGLRSFLETEPDIRVVGEAANGKEAVSAARELQPDIVLMDLLMPVMSGVEATAAITAAGMCTRVVVLTSSLDDTMIINALKAGAVGYILKSSAAGRVLDAVRQGAQGQSVLDESVQQRVIGQLRNTTKNRCGRT